MLRFITPTKPIECPAFCRRFSGADVAAARLTVTAMGVYRAFCNGRRLGDAWLTPGFNDYDAYIRLETFDLTPMLNGGENTLEVLCGKGWAMSRLGPNSGDPYHWSDRYLLHAELTLEYADDRSETLDTDGEWTACQSPVVMSELYDGECRDDTVPRGEPVACAAEELPMNGEAWACPPIRAVAELRPTLLRSPAGEAILDFGQNFAGVVRFHSRMARGESVRIETCEVLQDGCFYRENLLTAKSAFIYTSDGREKDVEPMFTFFGFRYARVSGLDRVDPGDFTGVALSSDLRRTLWATTGHGKLNRLLLNAMWSQRSNFLDLPTDCPQRDERLGWTGDAQVFACTACYHMDCRDFYRKFIRDMREEQTRRYGGDIPMYVPSLKGEAGPGGALWADAAVVIPWEVYMAYGDFGRLRESYPLMRDYVETLIRRDESMGGGHTAFADFTFGDWLAQDGVTDRSVFGGTEHAFLQTCCYLRSVEITCRAARALGRRDDAERYAALARDIRAAALDEYFAPSGRLALDTQTAYVLALTLGLGRDPERVVRSFRDRLRRDMWGLKCGFAGTPLALPAMFESGMEAEAYRILLSEEFPGWLYEVNMGATTIWERWNSMLPDGRVSDTGMNSFNHYACGSVCEAVYACVMGLANRAPGWREALIAPRIDARLGEARLRLASEAGEWRVAWRIDREGFLTLEAAVPPGATAVVALPDWPSGAGEARVNVPGGETLSRRYRPARDYLHPFDGHSLILDLLRCPQAAELMRAQAPRLYEAATAPGSDVRSWRLDQLTWGTPRAARTEVPALAEKLPGICVLD